MSKIYEFLREKANDPNYQNEVYFHFNPFRQWKLEKKKYTFLNLYNAVNECINLFKKTEYKHMVGKPCFMVANRRFQDIVEFIALMELGAKPIPIFSSVLYKNYISNNNMDCSNLYEIAPKISYIQGKILTFDQISIYKDSLGNFFPPDPLICNKSELFQTISNSVDLDGLLYDDFDFAILTGGTTNKNKIFKIREEDFIKAVKAKYDCITDETYVCQSPISSISGMLFDIYIPIIGSNKSVYIGTPEYNENLSNPNVMLPANFLEHGSLDYQTVLNSSNPCKITLFGGKVNPKVMDELLKFKERQKNFNKRDFSIINYYGRTENYGLISEMDLTNESNVYLLYTDINKDGIIYSYDRRTAYYEGIDNFFMDSNEVTFKYGYFASKFFCEIYPIAKLNNSNESIKINGKVFGKIIVDGKDTGDYGALINNKIYLVGRETDFIELNKGALYYITQLESLFNMKYSDINIKKKDLPLYNHPLSAQFYIVKNGTTINLYIKCNCFQEFYDNWFEMYSYMFKNIKKEFEEYRISIDNVFLCKPETINEIFENSKIRKYKLLNIKLNCDFNEINDVYDINKKLIERIENIFQRKISIKYDEKTRYYIFSKREFNIIEIIIILSKFRVLDFKYDSDNYYLGISDDFLFDKALNEKDKNIDYDKIIFYQKLIESHTMRDFLIDENRLKYLMPFKIAYCQEENRLIAKANNISRFLIYESVGEKYSSLKEEEYTDDVVEYKKTINLYDAFKLGYKNKVINDEFSIDSDNNFYCNEEKITFDYRTPDIYNMMYELLLEHKKELKKEGRLCKTLI